MAIEQFLPDIYPGPLDGAHFVIKENVIDNLNVSEELRPGGVCDQIAVPQIQDEAHPCWDDNGVIVASFVPALQLRAFVEAEVRDNDIRTFAEGVSIGLLAAGSTVTVEGNEIEAKQLPNQSRPDGAIKLFAISDAKNVRVSHNSVRLLEESQGAAIRIAALVGGVFDHNRLWATCQDCTGILVSNGSRDVKLSHLTLWGTVATGIQAPDTTASLFEHLVITADAMVGILLEAEGNVLRHIVITHSDTPISPADACDDDRNTCEYLVPPQGGREVREEGTHGEVPLQADVACLFQDQGSRRSSIHWHVITQLSLADAPASTLPRPGSWF